MNIYNILSRLKSVLAFVTVLFLLQLSYGQTVPPFLYHWTNNKGLSNIAKSIRKNHGQLNFNYSPPEIEGVGVEYPLISESLPFIKPGEVLFTWSHPVGGMGLSLNEIYAGSREGSPTDTTPKLLILKMRNDTKVVTIRSDEWSINNFLKYDSNGEVIREPSEHGLAAYKLFVPDKIDSKNVDVYRFENWQTDLQGKKFLYFAEYVIVNPLCVESYSANPKTVREVLRKSYPSEKEKLDNSEIYGSDHNKLFSSERGLVVVRNILSNTLKFAGRNVPSELNEKLVINSCQYLFH